MRWKIIFILLLVSHNTAWTETLTFSENAKRLNLNCQKDSDCEALGVFKFCYAGCMNNSSSNRELLEEIKKNSRPDKGCEFGGGDWCPWPVQCKCSKKTCVKKSHDEMYK